MRFIGLCVLALAALSSVSCQPHMEMEREVIREETRTAREHPGLVLGGHLKGPAHLRTPEQIAEVRTFKAEAKTIQREHELKIASERKIAEEEALRKRDKDLKPAERKRAHEIDEIKVGIKAKSEQVRLMKERRDRFQRELDATNSNHIVDTETPTESVSKIKLKPLHAMYTNEHDVVIPEKLERLKEELPNYEALEQTQRDLKARLERLRYAQDPAYDTNQLQGFRTKVYSGGWKVVGESWGFAGEKPTPADHGSYAYETLDPSANKNSAVAHIAREIMTTENSIHRDRISSIQRNIDASEHSIRNDERQIQVINNPVSEHNQRFGAANVDSMEGDFVPNYESPKAKFHQRKSKVHVSIDVQ